MSNSQQKSVFVYVKNAGIGDYRKLVCSALVLMAGIFLGVGRASAQVAVYYPFDEDTVFTNQSLWGASYDLQLAHEPHPTITGAGIGVLGEAASFPGDDENDDPPTPLQRLEGILQIPDNVSGALDVAYPNFSLSLWLQPNTWADSVNRTITGKSSSGSDRGWFLEKRATNNADNNQLKFQFWESATGSEQDSPIGKSGSQEFHFTPAAVLPADDYTHVSVTFAGIGAGGGDGFAKLYVNGIEVPVGDSAYGTLAFIGVTELNDTAKAVINGNNNIQFKIGNRGGNTSGTENSYSGLIDDYGLSAGFDTTYTATALEIALIHGLGRLAGVGLGALNEDQSNTQILDVLNNAYFGQSSALAGGYTWEYVASGLGGDTPVIGSIGGAGTEIDPYFIVLDTNGSGVAAVAPPPLSGDYNGDGFVNAADYVLWRDDPGTHGGDPDGYDAWRANFGKPAGTGSIFTGNPVPEPNALTFVVAAALAAMFFRRRFSRSEPIH